MTPRRTVWWGADPGGKGGFGVAILGERGQARTRTLGCVAEALCFFESTAGERVAGLGVDCPLWWSAGVSGDRRADQRLRKGYGLGGGNVQTVNSLRGAAIAQGMLLVSRLREWLPRLPVTEVHPKALLRVPGRASRPFLSKYGSVTDHRTEHERDALIAAAAASAGFGRRWTCDLSLDRLREEQDPQHHWIGPVNYFWPEEPPCNS